MNHFMTIRKAPLRSTLSALLFVFCAILSGTAHATAVYTVTTPWKYGQPVVITGDGLRGDQPDQKQLCIAPQISPTLKTCYGESQLPGVKWTNSTITFSPPDSTPAHAVVTLQLYVVPACLPGTTCAINAAPVEQAVGNIDTIPTVNAVTDVTASAAGVPAMSIEPWKTYKVDGTFFGDTRGSIYLRQSRGSMMIPDAKVMSWSKTSIVFASPPDAEIASGLSVNNEGTAQWYDFASTASGSSATSTAAAPMSTDPIAPIIKKMKVIGVMNVFHMLQDSQKIVDQYASDIATAGSLTDAKCQSMNFKQTTDVCHAICTSMTNNTCKASCADTDLNSSCMLACYSYKDTTDAENLCMSSCQKECTEGTPCVCEGGKVNIPADHDLLGAKNTLLAGYTLLNEDSTTEKTLIQDLQWQIQQAGLWFVKQNGNAVLIQSTSTSTPASSTTTSPSLTASVLPGVFTDVDAKTDPYAAAIQWAKDSGVSQGYPDGTFQPERVVNRAELLKFVLTLEKVTLDTSDTPTGFYDVPRAAWYGPYARTAREKRIIEGYSDGTFKPNQAVNGAEALKIAYNALGISTDVSSSGPWYQRYLQHAQQNKILFDSTLSMDTGMKRKDVVWMLWKLATLKK